MASELIMPQLGLTMTEGTVSQWLKREGDVVKKGEEVVEVETDKINNIVEAPEDGILLKIVKKETYFPLKVFSVLSVQSERRLFKTAVMRLFHKAYRKRWR